MVNRFIIDENCVFHSHSHLIVYVALNINSLCYVQTMIIRQNVMAKAIDYFGKKIKALKTCILMDYQVRTVHGSS